MNALVLYESKFGNTEHVAEAVALVLQESMPTRLATVGDVESCTEALRGIGLLVVGGPTHRHGISMLLHEALAELDEHALEGVKAAVFDTRLHGPRIVTGSAAVRLGRLLRHHGAWVVVPPASFLVAASEGPLDGCELDHAREWAREVLIAVGIRPREHAVI
jgi:flavorubredoxin